jgi:lipopolysaccharide export system protein LptA
MHLNKKSIIIIVSFMVFCFSVVVTSVNTSTKRDMIKSHENFKKKVVKNFTEFSKVSFYGVEDEVPTFQLKAEYLDVVNNSDMTFILPKGEVYKEGRKFPIKYTSEEGSYDYAKRRLRLNGSVHFENSDSIIKSQKFDFYINSGELLATGDLSVISRDFKTGDRIFIDSQLMKGNTHKKHFIYKDNVVGQIKRKRAYEEGFKFSTDSLDVDLNNSNLVLSGSVKINRSKFKLLAGKGEFFLENYNKKLKYYALYDDIRLEETLKLRDGSELTRRAYSEKLEGFNSEGKVVLTGAPRVIQGKDIIKGYQVTLREDVELVEVEDSSSSFSIKGRNN